MKKSRVQTVVLMLLALLLCVGYFATPIRPEIARFTANRYLQKQYPQYAFPPAEIVSTGYRQFYWFEWVTDYGAQSLNNPYFAYIACNGFLPFLVQESELWQLKDSGDILIDP
ncbi:MAG: hypothetical protein RR295_10115 [Oscillospiraceae bacterium]